MRRRMRMRRMRKKRIRTMRRMRRIRGMRRMRRRMMMRKHTKLAGWQAGWSKRGLAGSERKVMDL